MKYNTRLLDRLYSTKCNYMQIHPLSLWRLTHFMHGKRKWKMPRIQKKLYILLYENRKYQSKMCTNRLYYVTKNCSTKKTYEPDNTRPGTQRYGYWTGNRTKDETSDRASSGEAEFEPLPCTSLHPTGSTSHTAGSESDRVRRAEPLPVYALNVGIKPSEWWCPMHSTKFCLVCFFF